MQLSARPEYPGYRSFKRMPQAARSRIRVSCDGVELKQVVYADTKRGYALAYSQDSQGLVLLNARKDACLLVQHRGAIAIEVA